MIRIILAIFVFSLNSFAITHPFNNKLQKLNIKLSKDDIRVANNIKQVFKLTQKGIINNKLIHKINKDIRRKAIFKDFRFWSKNLLRISNHKKTRKVRTLCSKLSENHFAYKMKQQLNQNLVRQCFGKYIQLLAKKSKYRLSFHRAEIKFIKFHTKYILNSHQEREIEHLLKQFRPHGKKHKLYSFAILDYFMAINRTPSTQLIQHLSLKAKHTRYLQQKDLEELNTNYVFYKELKRLKQHAFMSVDTETDQHHITKAYNEVLNYFNLTYDNQPKDKALLTLQSISKSYSRRGHYYLARKGLKKILEKKSYHYNSALFDYLWSYILEKDYEQVLASLKTYKLDQEFLDKNPKVHFWMAKTYKKLGHDKNAQSMFARVVEKSPLSYYAILASKYLGKVTNSHPDDIFQEVINKNSKNFIFSSKTINYPALKKIALWAKVHQTHFMQLELAKITNVPNKKYVEQNLTAIAYLLSKNNEYLKSFQIIYKSLNNNLISLNRTHLNILFPRPFFNQIKYNSRSFDPIIALSLIRQESGFNTTAKSHVGARGLMQLMPRTARQMRRRLKIKHLYNPKTNIKLGTKFFQKLLDHYDENLVYSLAAYNAGQRRVDEWQSSYLNKKSILLNIENIPFKETRKYVKLIFRNIFFYKMLNKNNLSDSKNINQIYDIKLGFAK